MRHLNCHSVWARLLGCSLQKTKGKKRHGEEHDESRSYSQKETPLKEGRKILRPSKGEDGELAQVK